MQTAIGLVWYIIDFFVHTPTQATELEEDTTFFVDDRDPGVSYVDGQAGAGREEDDLAAPPLNHTLTSTSGPRGIRSKIPNLFTFLADLIPRTGINLSAPSGSDLGSISTASTTPTVTTCTLPTLVEREGLVLSAINASSGSGSGRLSTSTPSEKLTDSASLNNAISGASQSGELRSSSEPYLDSGIRFVDSRPPPAHTEV
ncbi:hypothetical protein VKT23_012273 [Stygiomarasmius scandens]|uniref:Uncharacterized protein n=1 Tax=Marasmiellus scandens TaxID=2682957 RepID=A0ABR1J936_9AGAR